jgi:site-specific DNA-methyltransferase (adenine-specific)
VAPRSALFRGDNLDVLRRHLPDASVDLVYLDPPFQSGRDYSVVYDRRSGKPERERRREKAFVDTWRWDATAEAACRDVESRGGRPAETLRALRTLLGESDALAYLAMMAPRLVELRRVMKPTASLYLHCDPTASHYLKVLLDGIFGPACFKNEVIWRYRRWPARARRYQRMHDVLLFYTASGGDAHTFHTLVGYEKLAESTLRTFGTRKQRADFSSGHRKPSVEEGETAGPPLSDAWEVSVIAPIGHERTGYPTQKPEALLERRSPRRSWSAWCARAATRATSCSTRSAAPARPSPSPSAWAAAGSASTPPPSPPPWSASACRARSSRCTEPAPRPSWPARVRPGLRSARSPS